MTKSENILLTQMAIGPMENFVYFVGDKNSGEVAVVDPGWDADQIKKRADKDGLKIIAILLTHGHSDHIGGVAELVEELDIPVHISREEAPFYMPQCKNLVTTTAGEILSIGQVKITCLHTPGHSPGCQCFLCGHHLLTGDTLFIDGCGRCDLPGGDASRMYHTLYDTLLKLPDETIIYPGHRYGPTDQATLGSQKQTNPYLQCSSEDEFLTSRMG